MEVLDNQETAAQELLRKAQTTVAAWFRDTSPTEVLDHPNDLDRTLVDGVTGVLRALPKDPGPSMLPPWQPRSPDLYPSFEVNFALYYEV